MASSAPGELEVNRAISMFSFEWKIKNFGIYTKIKTGEYIISPDFKVMFDGKIHLFNLKLYPNGDTVINKNYLTLKLLDNGSNHQSLPLSMFRMHIVNDEGKKIHGSIHGVMNGKKFTKNNHSILSEFYEKKNLFDPKTRALMHGILVVQFIVGLSMKLYHLTETIYNIDLVNKFNKNYATKAYEDYEKLLDDEKFSDVKFMIGDKTIHSHRVILISRSQVFKAMLEHPMKENQNGKVEITDIKYEVMKELLRFLYASKVNGIEKIAADLLVAADKYAIDDLKDLCEKSLYGTLNCGNAIKYLILTSSCNTVQLKSQVIQFINDHPDIVDQSEFKTIDSDIMYEVIRAMANKRMKY